MNVRLILNRNRKCVWSAQLSHTEAVLGRARGCTVRIPSSEVSRQHCRLRIDDDIVTVEDLESVNGTFVNGTRVRDIETVNPGDRLTLGPVTFVVEYEPSTESLEALADADDFPMVELADEVEAIEDSTAQPAISPIPMVEPTEEVEPPAAPVVGEEPRSEPIMEMEETVDELSILDDPSSEIRLPGSSDDLRDFLIELDDSSERPDLR